MGPCMLIHMLRIRIMFARVCGIVVRISNETFKFMSLPKILLSNHENILYNVAKEILNVSAQQRYQNLSVSSLA